MRLPLSGVKVLDLSRLLPGPYATLVLADLGATVDKLEDPQGGDYLRQSPPFAGDESALFLGLNRNKRSVVLDLKRPEAPAVLRRLVKSYDVLVESFRPGVMERLGCGYESLSREHPGLVYCAISGFGQTGPDALRAAHDLNLVARAGVLGYGGQAGGAPGLPGGQMADIGASLFGLTGILAALVERAQTGRGRLVDVSMLESATAFVHMQLAARLVQGAQGAPLARGTETLNGGLPHYGVYRTLDGKWLAVASLEPRFLEGFLSVVGLPELMADCWTPGEVSAAAREKIAGALARRSQAEWVAAFRARDLCVEPVAEGDDVLADPQLRARGLFVDAHGKTWLRTPCLGPPAPVTVPPALGEQSRQVLGEAGFTAAEIDALLAV